jgi:hypothetical protein
LWSVNDAFIKYQTPFHLENNDWVRQCESGLENTNNIVRDRSTIWNIEKQAVIKYDIKNSFGHQAVIKNQFKYKEILIKRIQKRQQE